MEIAEHAKLCNVVSCRRYWDGPKQMSIDIMWYYVLIYTTNMNYCRKYRPCERRPSYLWRYGTLWARTITFVRVRDVEKDARLPCEKQRTSCFQCSMYGIFARIISRVYEQRVRCERKPCDRSVFDMRQSVHFQNPERKFWSKSTEVCSPGNVTPAVVHVKIPIVCTLSF